MKLGWILVVFIMLEIVYNEGGVVNLLESVYNLWVENSVDDFFSYININSKLWNLGL